MNKVKVMREIIFSLLIIFVVIMIRLFLVTPAIVKGTSMYPTLGDKDVLIVKKYDKTIKRFDIVVIKHEGTMLVKRVIGLPGEQVEYKDSKLYINNIEIEEKFDKSITQDFNITELEFSMIPRGFYFVVGDNRDNSQDSRAIGFISKEEIIGKTNFRLFPFTSFGKIDK